MFVLRFLIYCRRARDVRLGATPPTYNQLSGMWLLSRLTAKVAMANNSPATSTKRVRCMTFELREATKKVEIGVANGICFRARHRIH